MFALAAFLRIGSVATNAVAEPAIKSLLPWIPHMGWLLAALLLAVLLRAARLRAV
jgi:uncharacterized membrane protein YcaP (DUF421 family)